jgi:hypothetical protein
MGVYRVENTICVMELDPRIVALLGGIILTFVGVSIPTEFDVANQMKEELNELYSNYDWCGENEQCKRVAINSIRNLETSLNTIELKNNMSTMFFWLGLFTSGGSILALVKS